MLIHLIRYEIKKYLHTSKIVGPLFILFAYLSMAFSMSPLGVLDSFSICGLVLFSIMIWVGISYNDIDYDMVEQTIYVKLKKKYYMYLSKVVLIIIISVCFSSISMIFALIWNAADQFQLFNRAVSMEDVFYSLIIMLMGATSGGIIGLSLNKFIISKRKIAVIIGVMAGLITITKNGINEEIPFMKLFTWILPPVCDLFEKFSKQEVISVSMFAIPLIWLTLYILFEVFVYVLLMMKVKYD